MRGVTVDVKRGTVTIVTKDVPNEVLLYGRKSGLTKAYVPWTHSTFVVAIKELRDTTSTYPFPTPQKSEALQIRLHLPVCLVGDQISGDKLTCAQETLDQTAVDIVRTFPRDTILSMTVVYGSNARCRGFAKVIVTDQLAIRLKTTFL